MPFRNIEAVRKEHDKIVAIRVNENGHKLELSLKEAYNYQIEIRNEIQKGRKDDSELPLYIVGNRGEIGFDLFKIDKVDDEYQLVRLDNRMDMSLKELPTF